MSTLIYSDAPEYDPHLETVSAATDHERKKRPKRKRKTVMFLNKHSIQFRAYSSSFQMFELEDAAPDVKMSAPSNSGNSNSRYSGGGGGGPKRKKDPSQQKDGKSTKPPRKRNPKGTRIAVQRSKGVRNNAEKVAMWEDHEKQYNKITETTEVLEDKSCDDEEQKMDEMHPDHNMDDDEEDIFEDDDDRYTPITLTKRPKYGQHGVFEQSEMINVLKENTENKNDFMFIQLPPILPLVSHLNENEKRDLSKFKRVKQGLLRQIGEGQIGKIRVRKSGKAEFVIGDLTMDINFASPMDSYQQIMHIHCENSMDGSYKGKSQFLGSVPPQNNLVCSYRAKDLLK